MESKDRVFLQNILFDQKDVLGSGAHGIVFCGTLTNGDVKVAVKKIMNSQLKTIREEDALRKLNHPNVVKLLEVEEYGEFRYFALELAAGNLKAFCDRQFNATITPRDGLVQMAQGVNYIHSQHLIHRDIKPENILIFQKKELATLKIADFGLTKETNDNGTVDYSTCCGTYEYMAPELYKNKEVRASSAVDTFALGCVYYVFLTRKHPFHLNVNILPRFNIPTNIQSGSFDLSGNQPTSAAKQS